MAGPTAGYKGKISISGASTAFSGGACTLVSGKTYQLNSSVQRLLDPAVARVWKDNNVAVSAANIAAEDLLFGKVTFIAGYTVTGPVTCDASYLPRLAVANIKSAKFDQKVDLLDTTSLNTSGYRSRLGAVMDVSGSLSLFDALLTDLDAATGGTQSFQSFLASRLPKLLELDPDGAGASVLRAWVVFDAESISLDPTGAVTGDVNFSLSDAGSAAIAAGASFGTP